MATSYAGWTTPPLTVKQRHVLDTLSTRPASVRQITDRLDRPVRGGKLWTRSEVRHTLEALVGRLRWTVRYKRTAA